MHSDLGVVQTIFDNRQLFFKSYGLLIFLARWSFDIRHNLTSCMLRQRPLHYAIRLWQLAALILNVLTPLLYTFTLVFHCRKEPRRRSEVFSFLLHSTKTSTDPPSCKCCALYLQGCTSGTVVTFKTPPISEELHPLDLLTQQSIFYSLCSAVPHN